MQEFMIEDVTVEAYSDHIAISCGKYNKTYEGKAGIKMDQLLSDVWDEIQQNVSDAIKVDFIDKNQVHSYLPFIMKTKGYLPDGNSNLKKYFDFNWLV